MAVDPVTHLFDVLRIQGCKPEKSGEGSFVSYCPAHEMPPEGHNKSLSLSSGKDGKAVIYCHAGCSSESIVSAMNLSMSDLFARDDNRPQYRDVATYDYVDEKGNTLSQKVRQEPKKFLQRRPDGKGGWIYKGVLKDTRRVLYHLDKIIEAREVYVVEGEKDADLLAKWGLVGTCNIEGASKAGQKPKWRNEYTEQLAEKDVVIIPDNDEAGIAHAHNIAKSITGTARSVRLMEPLGNSKKGFDLSDYAENGGDFEGLDGHVVFTGIFDPDNPPQFVKAIFEKEEDDQVSAHDYEEKKTTDTSSDTENTGSLSNTEFSNADVLIEKHIDDFFYEVEMNQWYLWNDRVWEEVSDTRIAALAKTIVKTDLVKKLAETEPGDKEWKAAMHHIRKSCKDSALNAMVHLAEKDERTWQNATDLDRDPWLLNLQNGILDLKNGELYSHDKKYMMSKICPVEWKGIEARSELFDDYLMRLCGAEASGVDVDSVDRLMAYYQIIAGYFLFGGNPEERFFLIHGPKRSGKSTFTSIIFSILGDARKGGYAISAEPDTFLATRERSDGSKARADIVSFMGSRFVFAQELPHNRQFDSAKMKSWSGGDPITARAPYSRRQVTFDPLFTMALTANDIPSLERSDPALWDRAIPLPFMYTIPDDDIDPNIKKTLCTPSISGPAILAWAVQGLLRYRDQGGFGPLPPEIVLHKISLFEEQNPLSAFIEEECEKDPELWIEKKKLHQKYVEWVRPDRPISYRRFCQEITSDESILNKKQRVDKNPKWGFQGIGIIGQEKQKEMF